MNPFSKEAYDATYTASKEYKKHYKDIKYYPIYKYVAENINSDGVVDLGCGAGHLAHMLYDNGLEYYIGIDFSSVAIEMARKRVPEFKFIKEDLMNLVYTDDQVTIIATEVFEHLENDRQLIRNMPKCKIIFSVPNFKGKNHYRTYDSESAIKKYYKGLIDIQSIKAFDMGKGNIIFTVIGKVC
jgi:trans-aconitate methyltransferase